MDVSNLVEYLFAMVFESEEIVLWPDKEFVVKV